MPSVVPAPLAHAAARLRCPTCSSPLASTRCSLRCGRGHSFDVSRHGHVALVPSRRRRVAGDDSAMVAARAAVFDAQILAPLTAALVRTALALTRGRTATVLDVGAGTGHHLAALLDALPGAHGIAFDASSAALRRAGRAHPRIAAVAGDVWREIPLLDASADLVTNVFAPRNPVEFTRVIEPGGHLIVATPATGHLRELAMLHPMRVHPRKRRLLHRQLEPGFDLAGVRRITWTVQLTARQAGAIVRMGPAAYHLTPADEQRLRNLPDRLPATAAVELHVLRRRARTVRR
jgi:SAM-dependent methyltransferase